MTDEGVPEAGERRLGQVKGLTDRTFGLLWHHRLLCTVRFWQCQRHTFDFLDGPSVAKERMRRGLTHRWATCSLAAGAIDCTSYMGQSTHTSGPGRTGRAVVWSKRDAPLSQQSRLQIHLIRLKGAREAQGRH